MVDPLTTAALGGVANAAGSKVIEAIVKGEDDHAEWRQQVIEIATEAEMARRYYFQISEIPDREDLNRLMERYGKQALKLEIIGERQEYPTNEVENIGKLARLCSEYASARKGMQEDPEVDLNESLPAVVESVFAFAE